MRDVVGARVDTKFNIYDDLIQSCGWAWWHENVCAISDRPSEIYRDSQGRLHSITGPSIAYRDGWKLYHVHGVRVDGWIIEQPERITVDAISKEENAEVRRVMIELYGAARYLLDSGARKVQADDYGILYRKELPDDEPLVMVRVLNSTPEPDGALSKAEAIEVFGLDAVQRRLDTMAALGLRYDEPRFKEYMLRVPPDMKTAHEAIAWTFEKTPKTYAPSIES